MVSKKRALSLEALDQRRVLTAGLMAAQTFNFNHDLIFQPVQDTTLSAFLQTTASGKTQVKVDGSIYNDIVKVTEVNYSTGNVTLQMDKFSGDVRLSSETVTLHSSNLDPYTPVAMQLRQGNDQVWN